MSFGEHGLENKLNAPEIKRTEVPPPKEGELSPETVAAEAVKELAADRALSEAALTGIEATVADHTDDVPETAEAIAEELAALAAAKAELARQNTERGEIDQEIKEVIHVLEHSADQPETEETTQIYENPEDDPLVHAIEDEIARGTNKLFEEMRKGAWGKISQGESETESQALWNRNLRSESLRAWLNFADQYPEKAAAYRAKKPYLDQALEQEEYRKQKEVETKKKAPETRPVQTPESRSVDSHRIDTRPMGASNENDSGTERLRDLEKDVVGSAHSEEERPSSAREVSPLDEEEEQEETDQRGALELEYQKKMDHLTKEERQRIDQQKSREAGRDYTDDLHQEQEHLTSLEESLTAEEAYVKTLEEETEAEQARTEFTEEIIRRILTTRKDHPEESLSNEQREELIAHCQRQAEETPEFFVDASGQPREIESFISELEEQSSEALERKTEHARERLTETHDQLEAFQQTSQQRIQTFKNMIQNTRDRIKEYETKTPLQAVA